MKVSKHPLVRDGAKFCLSRMSRLLSVTALAAMVLVTAPVAIAQPQSGDCAIVGLVVRECGSTATYFGSLPVAVNPYSASWSLLNNTTGASFVGPTSCAGIVPPAGSCQVQVAVGVVGTFDLKLTLTAQSGAQKFCSVTVTVVDTTPPVITCAPNANFECGTNPPTTNPTAVDCSPVTYTHTDAPGQTNCAGTGIIRTWIGTDASGNVSAPCIQILTPVDTTPPTLTCPPNVSLPCGANTTPYNPAVSYAAVSDTCCQNIDVFSTDVVTGSCPNGMTITRTWHGVDCCGNQSTCVQIITVGTGPSPCPLAAVTGQGGACESDAPKLYSSLPISPNPIHFRVTSSVPNSLLLFAAQLAPFSQPESFAAGCGTLYVDVANPTTLVMGQNTDAAGSWAQSFGFDLSLVPSLVGAPILIQAGVFTGGSGGVLLSNALQVVGGACPLYFTYPREQYAANGPANALVNANWQNVFATGLMIGDYNLGSGAVAPNGVIWTSDAAGAANLKAFLAAPGGVPASLPVDEVNAVTSASGSLARQTAVLQLNVALSAAGALGSAPYGSLVYLNAGDSLSGRTIDEILAACNQALAGLGLPAGYTYLQLAVLLENLSLSFTGGSESFWASGHLFQG